MTAAPQSDSLEPRKLLSSSSPMSCSSSSSSFGIKRKREEEEEFNSDFDEKEQQKAFITTANTTTTTTTTGDGDGPNDEPLFPVKLFSVLEDAEKEGFAQVVSWGSDGTAFRVHKKRDFENMILPKYFKMTKYKSFTRQLHNYGFIWLRKGPDKGGFQHSCFKRSDRSMSYQLLRKPKRAKGGDSNSDFSLSPSSPGASSLLLSSTDRMRKNVPPSGDRRGLLVGEINASFHDDDMAPPSSSSPRLSLREGFDDDILVRSDIAASTFLDPFSIRTLDNLTMNDSRAAGGAMNPTTSSSIAAPMYDYLHQQQQGELVMVNNSNALQFLQQQRSSNTAIGGMAASQQQQQLWEERSNKSSQEDNITNNTTTTKKRKSARTTGVPDGVSTILNAARLNPLSSSSSNHTPNSNVLASSQQNYLNSQIQQQQLESNNFLREEKLDLHQLSSGGLLSSLINSSSLFNQQQQQQQQNPNRAIINNPLSFSDQPQEYPLMGNIMEPRTIEEMVQHTNLPQENPHDLGDEELNNDANSLSEFFEFINNNNNNSIKKSPSKPPKY